MVMSTLQRRYGFRMFAPGLCDRGSGLFAVLLAIALCCIPVSLQAQSTAGAHSEEAPLPEPFPHDAILLPSPFVPFLIGPYIGPDYTVHRGNFTLTEDGITCCTFENGTGLGFTAGVKAFLPFGGDNYLSPRLAYTLHNGAFDSYSEPFPLFGVDDTIEDVRFRDELSTPLPAVAADLMYCYRLGIDSTLGVYAIAGPGLEYIAGAKFTKTETIAVLDGVTYLNGETTREEEFDYKDDAASLMIVVRAGLSLLYKVSDHLYLNPEITGGLPLNVINDNWRMFEFQGTFGLILGL